MKITDEAVGAAAEAIKNGRPFRHAETARAALTAALPHMGEVRDETIEVVAKKIADFLGYDWDSLNNYSVVEKGYRMFTHGQFGWSFQGGQPDLRNVARDMLEAALASHDPTSEPANSSSVFHLVAEVVEKAKRGEIADNPPKTGRGPQELSLFLSSSEPAKDEPEVVAWECELATRIFGGVTSDKAYAGFEKRLLDKEPRVPEGSVRDLEPLIRLSDYEALRVENERLQDDAEYWAGKWMVDTMKLEDRNAELAAIVEEFVTKFYNTTFSVNDPIWALFKRARAALKGQSNES